MLLLVQFTSSLMLSFHKLHLCGKEYRRRNNVNLLSLHRRTKVTELQISLLSLSSLLRYSNFSLNLETNNLFSFQDQQLNDLRSIHLRYLVVRFNSVNAASLQKANAQKRPRDVAAKTGTRKILFIASPRKSSFTQTPTITPTS